MDIKPLRYFVTLVDLRHFGRAASKLHISQPPLSRQLAALEESLGVKLLERNSRNVELTAAGKSFYEDARKILVSLEQAGHNARAAAAGKTGSLRIGFTMCAAYSVLPRYAQAFRSAWPNVTLQLREIISNDLSGKITSGEIDAAIMLPSLTDTRLATKTVVREALCVALSHNHPLARMQLLRADQLSQEPFVCASEEAAPSLHSAITQHCRANGFDPDMRFEVQLQQTVLSLVSEGAGVALVPESMKKAQLSGVAFRALADAPTIEQVLAWLPSNHNPCLARWLECVDE